VTYVKYINLVVKNVFEPNASTCVMNNNLPTPRSLLFLNYQHENVLNFENEWAHLMSKKEV